MKLNTLALALLLTPIAGSALAEVTFTPFATYRHFDNQTVEKLSAGGVTPDIKGKEGYGLSLGYRFTPAFGLEAHVARTETKTENTPVVAGFNGLNIRGDRLSVDGYYAFNAESKFSPYVLLGAGQGRIKTPGTSAQDTIVNAGLGAFYRFNDKVALRMEAREVFNSDEDLNDAVAMLGLEFSPGAVAAAVVQQSEPVQQPEPEQAPVEEQAAPVAVAPIDTDGDGVPDSADKCSSTPAGVQVDGMGCPLDDDADGVPNYLDKCPSTAAGVVVDTNGCDKILTETISQELKINFDSGKAVVKDEYKAEAEKVAALLKQYPSTSVEIQGHTDSSGKKASNDKLSQDRADAVKGVLVSDFGIDAGRITATGYGSAQPIADNKTVEGRAQNRRVIAVVSGEAKRVIRKKK
ncbi:MAG: OmpA family protein [Moraxellaceae bacterium]|jgi:OOP family OmpA-OmpF porin|nr:OmpA family protein [Moraxellaceae bacterium]MBP7229762.1 OmpA family protein [Moraxellaceae bacterium]MBP9045735.1 OmpA family protein [Moraxellaceae bacterium]